MFCGCVGVTTCSQSEPVHSHVCNAWPEVQVRTVAPNVGSKAIDRALPYGGTSTGLCGSQLAPSHSHVSTGALLPRPPHSTTRPRSGSAAIAALARGPGAGVTATCAQPAGVHRQVSLNHVTTAPGCCPPNSSAPPVVG